MRPGFRLIFVAEWDLVFVCYSVSAASVPSLSICPKLPQLWVVIIQYKENKPVHSLSEILLVREFNHTKKQACQIKMWYINSDFVAEKNIGMLSFGGMWMAKRHMNTELNQLFL